MTDDPQISEASAGYARSCGLIASAMASGMWKAAKDANLEYIHVVDACALLLAAVSRNSGSEIETVIDRVMNQVGAVKRPNTVFGSTAASECAAVNPAPSKDS